MATTVATSVAESWGALSSRGSRVLLLAWASGNQYHWTQDSRMTLKVPQGFGQFLLASSPHQYDKWLLSWESTKSVCKRVTKMGPHDFHSSQEGGTGECLTEEWPWARSGLP